jgi:hypothetical protein
MCSYFVLSPLSIGMYSWISRIILFALCFLVLENACFKNKSSLLFGMPRVGPDFQKCPYSRAKIFKDSQKNVCVCIYIYIYILM